MVYGHDAVVKQGMEVCLYRVLSPDLVVLFCRTDGVSSLANCIQFVICPSKVFS